MRTARTERLDLSAIPGVDFLNFSANRGTFDTLARRDASTSRGDGKGEERQGCNTTPVLINLENKVGLCAYAVRVQESCDNQRPVSPSFHSQFPIILHRLAQPKSKGRMWPVGVFGTASRLASVTVDMLVQLLYKAMTRSRAVAMRSSPGIVLT